MFSTLADIGDCGVLPDLIVLLAISQILLIEVRVQFLDLCGFIKGKCGIVTTYHFMHKGTQLVAALLLRADLGSHALGNVRVVQDTRKLLELLPRNFRISTQVRAQGCQEFKFLGSEAFVTTEVRKLLFDLLTQECQLLGLITTCVSRIEGISEGREFLAPELQSGTLDGLQFGGCLRVRFAFRAIVIVVNTECCECFEQRAQHGSCNEHRVNHG